MTLIAITCLLLVPLTTVLHYESLGLLTAVLPVLRMAGRAKLIIVVLAAFTAHALQIALYALALWALIHFASAGSLGVGPAPGLPDVLYFSAETYTSLGYGDLVPTGPLRVLAGVEALNGLLLIGWTASYLYVAMERFWDGPDGPR